MAPTASQYHRREHELEYQNIVENCPRYVDQRIKLVEKSMDTMISRLTLSIKSIQCKHRESPQTPRRIYLNRLRQSVSTTRSESRNVSRGTSQNFPQLLGCIQQQHQQIIESSIDKQLPSFPLPFVITNMTTVFSKPASNPGSAMKSPSLVHANRFSALLDDAINQSQDTQMVSNPSPKGLINSSAKDEDTWIVPLNKRAKRIPQQKETSSNKKKNGSTPPVLSLIPKTLPKKIPDPEFPDPQYIINTFSIDCRIKVKPYESVNPSRLIKAVLMMFQTIDNQTALTTSMYHEKGCPMICDPDKIPTSEENLTQFVSSWKKIRSDMFMCRFHMVSASPYAHMKKDPDVFEYLREEDIFLEQALLASSDHHLVGFLVNIVPDEGSIRAQQARFEAKMKNLPGFQLVIRKLNFKENSRLWCDVLKVRVDRADADEITIAFNAASAVSNDFKYYAFDEYSGLHDNQKRYIIETQRNFVLQNRSVIIEWPLTTIPKFTMWMEPQTDDDEGPPEPNAASASELLTQEVDYMDESHGEPTPGQKRGRSETKVPDGINQIDTSKKPKTPSIPRFNNLDLTVTGIDDFLYSYTSSDGTPLIRFAYPPVDEVRELLVSRGKRAEVNTLLKVIMRELARNMSDFSRSITFPNADEIYEEALNTTSWQPSQLSKIIPHSTTMVQTKSRVNGSSKRRATSSTFIENSRHNSGIGNQQDRANSPQIATSESVTSGTEQSSSPTGSMPPSRDQLTPPSNNLSSSIAGPSAVHLFQAQLQALQQQHNKLFENVQQIARTQKEEMLEVHHLLESSHEKVEQQVEYLIDKHGTQLIDTITKQCNSSIAFLRTETKALDKKQSEQLTALKSELSGDISSAIDKLTTVVANMTMHQAQFIQKSSEDRENDKRILHDQLSTFMHNVKASGMLDVTTKYTAQPSSSPTVIEPTTTIMHNMQMDQDASETSTECAPIERQSSTVRLTPLQNNIKRAGRGGGRIGIKELRQQTLSQTLSTQPTSPTNSTKLLIPENIRQANQIKTMRIETQTSTQSTSQDTPLSTINSGKGNSHT